MPYVSDLTYLAQLRQVISGQIHAARPTIHTLHVQDHALVLSNLPSSDLRSRYRPWSKETKVTAEPGCLSCLRSPTPSSMTSSIQRMIYCMYWIPSKLSDI